MAFLYRHGDRPLEGYTILRGIGRGGFGEVYYAVSDGGREVALKVVQQNSDIELRGVRHCMNLKNPHLVSIFDVRLNDDEVPFVLMEYVKGPSLRDIIRQSPSGCGVEQAAFFVTELARGLSYLHSSGIVHRDLKPENIFLEDGYVKIGDYGLSKFISVSHQSGQTISVGSVHYMAPEIGSGNYQKSIDVYALGVILYELLTGEVPFNGDSMGEILMKHLSCEPDLEAVDPELREVVAKAMAKKPEERYASAEALVEDLLARLDLKRRVAEFDPTRLSNVGETQEPELQNADLAKAATAIPAAAPSPRPMPRPNTPPVAGAAAAATAAASEASETVAAAVGAQVNTRSDWERRLFMGVVTAVSMALGVWLLTNQSGQGFPFTYALLILAGAVPVLLAQTWAVPRFGLDKGLPRTLATFAIAGPPLALGSLAVGVPRAIPALLAGLVFIDWSARTNRRRDEMVSLGEAFTAGLFGVIAGYLVQREAFFAGGTLAAMSLVVNAISPFDGGRKQRRRDNGTRHKPRGDRRRAPPPPPPQHRSPQAPAALASVGAAVPPSAPVSPPSAPVSPPSAPVSPPSAPVSPPSAPVSPPKSPLPPYAGATRARSHKSHQLTLGNDRVFAGVCGGLAEHFNWDPTVVRLIAIAIMLVTSGTALLGYFIFWLVMPANPVTLKAAAVYSKPRSDKPGLFGRIVCAVFGLATAALGIGLSIGGLVQFAEHRFLEEASLLLGFGILSLLVSMVFWWKVLARKRYGFVRGTLQPFATMTLFGGAATTGILSAQALRGEDEVIAGGVAIAFAAIAVFLGSNWLRWWRRQRPPPPRHDSAGGGGWMTLGMLLMTLAAMTLVAATLFGMRALPDPFDIRVFSSSQPDFTPLLVPLFFFIPGLFAILMSRRWGGSGHVARGVVGWLSGAVFCAGFSAVFIEKACAAQSINTFFDILDASPRGDLLLGFLAIGAFAVLCLAWPASRRSYRETTS